MKKILYFIAIILLTSAICSCRSVRYVPVESSSTVRDSVNVIDSTAIRWIERTVDSVRIRDSVVITQDENGNILKEEYYRETERYKSLEREYNELLRKYEALKAAKTDTIRVPYPVERELTRWQRFKLDVGGIAIGTAIAAVLAVVVWLVIRFRRK